MAIIGRPNVGKSTLVNSILGEKIAAVSFRPQTTRQHIMGIYNDSEAQIVFMDTPGLITPKHSLDRFLVRESFKAQQEADLIMVMIDAKEGVRPEDIKLFQDLAAVPKKKFVLINKIDLVPKLQILKLTEACSQAGRFEEYLPLSAREKEDALRVVAMAKKYLATGPRLYPDDQLTDKNERFIAAEMIREEMLKILREEVPHAIAVRIQEFKEREGKALIYIKAIIYVERVSQKSIVIGKNGVMLKSIGEKSRLAMEKFFNKKIFLELWVKVEKNWRKNEQFLKKLGFEG